MRIHKSSVRLRPRHASVDIAFEANSASNALTLSLQIGIGRGGSVQLTLTDQRCVGEALPRPVVSNTALIPALWRRRERVSKARAESISPPFVQLPQGFATRSFAEHEA